MVLPLQQNLSRRYSSAPANQDNSVSVNTGLDSSSSSREEHLQRSGSEGLHDSSHVCHELSDVHADLSAVKHEGVRHSGVSLLGHKTGGLAGFLLVFSLWDENRKVTLAHRIILPSICIAIKLKRSYTLFCQELEHWHIFTHHRISFQITTLSDKDRRTTCTS